MPTGRRGGRSAHGSGRPRLRSGRRVAILLAALTLSGCGDSERNTASHTVDATHAYAVILDSVAAQGTSHLDSGQFRLSVAPTRPIAALPTALPVVLDSLEARGYPAADASAPLCPGEVRVSFSPPLVEAPAVYVIEAEVAYAWTRTTGDIEWFLYRVDCTSGLCAVSERTFTGQDEIGIGPCADSSGSP